MSVLWTPPHREIPWCQALPSLLYDAGYNCGLFSTTPFSFQNASLSYSNQFSSHPQALVITVVTWLVFLILGRHSPTCSQDATHSHHIKVKLLFLAFKAFYYPAPTLHFNILNYSLICTLCSLQLIPLKLIFAFNACLWNGRPLS